MGDSRGSPHQCTAIEFARRVRDRYGTAVDAVYLFGSVVRGEARGPDSDGDLLVVLRDGVDEGELEERIRDLAYDVELAHGIVLSLVVTSASEYERRKERPFFRRARRDAEALYG